MQALDVHDSYFTGGFQVSIDLRTLVDLRALPNLGPNPNSECPGERSPNCGVLDGGHFFEQVHQFRLGGRSNGKATEVRLATEARDPLHHLEMLFRVVIIPG